MVGQFSGGSTVKFTNTLNVALYLKKDPRFACEGGCWRRREFWEVAEEELREVGREVGTQ